MGKRSSTSFAGQYVLAVISVAFDNFFGPKYHFSFSAETDISNVSVGSNIQRFVTMLGNVVITTSIVLD